MMMILLVGLMVFKVYDIVIDGNGFLGLEIYFFESVGICKWRFVGVNVVQGWYVEVIVYMIDYEMKFYEMWVVFYIVW